MNFLFSRIHVLTYVKNIFLLTSDIRERSAADNARKIFPSAGYAFNDYRQKRLLMNLEMQLFLKVNTQFWSEETLNKVMRSLLDEM